MFPFRQAAPTEETKKSSRRRSLVDRNDENATPSRGGNGKGVASVQTKAFFQVPHS